MLGPLVKAQLVAFLTNKLLESKAFTGAVASLHGSVTKLQQGAYDRLLQATEEYDRKHPPPHLQQEATSQTHRPRQSEPIRDQQAELLKLIEKTRRELEKDEGQRRP
ncbi:uncharacterized protein JCM10292_006103 [Rhodotorula paludigena]|uniref:uncharacterized protein n=1 Tax=Rhodotorula paludigena TaxID=86838 RepID=UPI0031749767